MQAFFCVSDVGKLKFKLRDRPMSQTLNPLLWHLMNCTWSILQRTGAQWAWLPEFFKMMQMAHTNSQTILRRDICRSNEDLLIIPQYQLHYTNRQPWNRSKSAKKTWEEHNMKRWAKSRGQDMGHGSLQDPSCRPFNLQVPAWDFNALHAFSKFSMFSGFYDFHLQPFRKIMENWIVSAGLKFSSCSSASNPMQWGERSETQASWRHPSGHLTTKPYLLSLVQFQCLALFMKPPVL